MAEKILNFHTVTTIFSYLLQDTHVGNVIECCPLGAKSRFNRSTYEVVSACQNEVTDDDKDGHNIHFGQGEKFQYLSTRRRKSCTP